MEVVCEEIIVAAKRLAVILINKVQQIYVCKFRIRIGDLMFTNLPSPFKLVLDAARRMKSFGSL